MEPVTASMADCAWAASDASNIEKPDTNVLQRPIANHPF